eukprot:gnl/TRDRNA2_/TRDRNA2_143247_c0_seq1.p1 gnl/TRDRNA2_/TRDRNA2_143247_c0~~gnl/TRDRNA2_/TRDRNA2_143247_c0_seq1.p1  ORF type:complete len:277 (+),score=44.09 gnl/TRDRNA2_/TRDRNA2_143247_c0_seq1:60-833(+)
MWGDAAAMAEKLCSPQGPENLRVRIRSASWGSSGVRLQVEGLAVAYHPAAGPDALSGVTFSLEPGEHVALIGAPASGKSALLLALCGAIAPRSGWIRLNNVDTASMGLGELRQAVGFIPAGDLVIFSDTLRQNLNPNGQSTDAEVLQALGEVGLGPWVATLPDGLDTVIAASPPDIEGSLTVVQRQLLGAARMVVKRPAMLVVDSSSCSSRMQDPLLAAVRAALPDTTLLAVTSAEAAAHFDRCVVLQDAVAAAAAA